MPLPHLFSLTLFLSAALLFSVQPLIARMLLPLLGGSPSVWNLCMLFFQGLLLAGYAYAHFSATRLSLRAQGIGQLILLLASLVFLPFGISGRALAALPTQSDPTLWLLATLFTTLGLPFFTLSTIAPLLQRWFAATNHASAKDPYFLYSASNLGSLIALLGYPLLLEPSLRLAAQSRLWFAVFILLIPFIAYCLLRTLRASARPLEHRTSKTEDSPLRPLHRLRWTLYAFIPSTLMLGVTSYLTTDIASIPLLWVIPLALYLITFIIVFARKPLIGHAAALRILPIATITLLFVLLSRASNPAWLVISIHLFFFFIAALVLHGHLAASRPAAQHLTQYYFFLSLGGCLGGLFNAILAPLLFNSIAEYPIAILLAAAAGLITSLPARKRAAIDLAFAATLALFTLAAAYIVIHHTSLPPGMTANGFIFGLPVILCYTFILRPFRFALGVALLLVVSSIYAEMRTPSLFAGRSFFGVSTISIDPTGRFRRLMHGGTSHGEQFLDPARRCEPISYYHRTGPLGIVFSHLDPTLDNARIAVIGMGTGSMATYARPGQSWTFYEIDPLVIRIAHDPAHFTFLNDCTPITPMVIRGDGRLRIREAPAGHYQMIVLDAFSSDAIPVHLITREALQLYLSKLTETGVLVMHISNRYLDLEPVIMAIAGDLSLTGRNYHEMVGDEESGKDASQWLILARHPNHLGPLRHDNRWYPLDGPPNTRPWTDDFSNILGIFKWN